MKKIISTIFAAALSLASVTAAQAALYTTNFGTALPTVSNCDDCFEGPISFGAGQSINFFGTTYNDLYVSSNGYVTFGMGSGSYQTAPIDTQVVAPMIAGFYTDLDSRNDAASNVFINTMTNGVIIATWESMMHYSQNTALRSTFQLVIRSDQAAIPAGEGQIGFFYGEITDNNNVSAGFGDGLAASNPGEVAFASNVPGTTLSNSGPRYFNLDGGVPVDPPTGVPEPGSLALLGLGLAGLLAARRKRV